MARTTKTPQGTVPRESLQRTIAERAAGGATQRGAQMPVRPVRPVRPAQQTQSRRQGGTARTLMQQGFPDHAVPPVTTRQGVPGRPGARAGVRASKPR